MKVNTVDINFFSDCFDLDLVVLDRDKILSNRPNSIKRYYCFFKNANEYNNGVTIGSMGNGSTEVEAIAEFADIISNKTLIILDGKNKGAKISTVKLCHISKKEIIDNKKDSRFMLLAENSDRPPKYVHSTASSALYEAKRLANNLECEITILEIVGSVKVVPKEVTEIIYTTESDYNDSFNKLLENENELPF